MNPPEKKSRAILVTIYVARKKDILKLISKAQL